MDQVGINLGNSGIPGGVGVAQSHKLLFFLDVFQSHSVGQFVVALILLALGLCPSTSTSCHRIVSFSWQI